MNKLQRLFLQDPDEYSAASLSTDQLHLHEFVQQWGSITSNQIAAAFCISVPSASGRLKALGMDGFMPPLGAIGEIVEPFVLALKALTQKSGGRSLAKMTSKKYGLCLDSN